MILKVERLIIESYNNEIKSYIINIESDEFISDIRNLDQDIDNYIKENDFKNVYKIISQYNCNKYDIDNMKYDMMNDKIRIILEISYMDLSKCIEEYCDWAGIYDNYEKYSNDRCRSIVYRIYYYRDKIYKERYERYGRIDLVAPTEYRYELSDYNNDNINRYKVGDIVKFKLPYNGYDNGIITSVYNNNECITNSMMYDIICDNNEKIVCLLCDPPKIHHNDILEVIGHDIKLAYKYAVQTHIYELEYLESLKKLI